MSSVIRRVGRLVCLLGCVVGTGSALALPGGTWNGTLACGPREVPPVRPAFRSELPRLAVSAQQFTFTRSFREGPAATPEATRPLVTEVWRGQARGNTYAVTATARRDNGDTWTYELEGPNVAGNVLVLQGQLTESTGQRARSCSLTLALAEASPAATAPTLTPPTPPANTSTAGPTAGSTSGSTSGSSRAAAPGPAPVPGPAPLPAPAPTARATAVAPAPPVPEDPLTLVTRGTTDPARLAQLREVVTDLDRKILLGREDPRVDKTGQLPNVLTALLSSEGYLDLDAYLDLTHPRVRKDLAGKITIVPLDDTRAARGQGPIVVRVIHATTRSRHTLTALQGYASSLMIDRNRPSLELRLEDLAVRERIAALLEAQGITVQGGLQGNLQERVRIEYALADSLPAGGSRGDAARAAEITLIYRVLTRPKKNASALLEAVRPAGALRDAPTAERVFAERQAEREQKWNRIAEVLARDVVSRGPHLGVVRGSELASLVAARANQQKADSERRVAAATEKAGELERAAQDNVDAAATALVYPRTAKQVVPRGTFCTAAPEGSATIKGMLLSGQTGTWIGGTEKLVTAQHFKTPDALYDAVLDGRCMLLIDSPRNLQTYVKAIRADVKFAVQLGPMMSATEALAVVAQKAGYDSPADYRWAEKIASPAATPDQLKAIRARGIATAEQYAAAIDRMNRTRYSTDPNPGIDAVLLFADDEMAGRKVGKTALQFREAEKARLVAEARAAEEARRAAAGKREREIAAMKAALPRRARELVDRYSAREIGNCTGVWMAIGATQAVADTADVRRFLMAAGYEDELAREIKIGEMQAKSGNYGVRRSVECSPMLAR